MANATLTECHSLQHAAHPHCLMVNSALLWRRFWSKRHSCNMMQTRKVVCCNAMAEMLVCPSVRQYLSPLTQANHMCQCECDVCMSEVDISTATIRLHTYITGDITTQCISGTERNFDKFMPARQGTGSVHVQLRALCNSLRVCGAAIPPPPERRLHAHHLLDDRL